MRATVVLAASSLLIPVFLIGCSRAPAPKPADSPPAASAAQAGTGWPGFVESFIEARFKADPYFAVQQGRHEFDGKMPDLSRAGIDADVAELRKFQGDLAKYDPASLTPAQRFEQEYLQWVIDTQLFWLTAAESPYRNPAWYLDKLDPSMYLTREYAPLPKRLEGFLGYARAVPKIRTHARLLQSSS